MTNDVKVCWLARQANDVSFAASLLSVQCYFSNAITTTTNP